MSNLWILGLFVFSVAACAQSPSVTSPSSKATKAVHSRAGHGKNEPTASKADGQFEVTAWIRSFSSRVAPLSRQLNLAYWNSSIGADAKAASKVASIEETIRILFSDRSRSKYLKGVSRDESIRSIPLMRELQVLLLEFEENQVSPSIVRSLVRLTASAEKSFASYRAVLDGEQVSDNDIYQTLAEQKDVALRRRAWEAFVKKSHKLQGPFMKLVRARNKAARAAGARDYFQLRLRMDEVDEKVLMDISERLLQQTDGAFGRLSAKLRACLGRRYGIESGQIVPWLGDDPFFQRIPSCALVDLEPLFKGTEPVTLAQKTFDALGIDMGGVLGRSDLLERPGKAPGSFCLDVDRSGDVRILANVRPGKSWTSTVLHELGHAAYLLGVDRDLPWSIRRPAGDSVSEAIAMLSADLVYEPAWIEGVIGVSSSRLKIRKKEILASRRAQLLLSLRFYLLMINFERELYADPEQDLSALWWRLAEKYQGLVFPQGQRPDGWPFANHLIQAPVYFHNYLMGRLMASQLRRSLVTPGDNFFSKKFWDKLQKKIFSKGALYPWDELLKSATGNGLDPSFFLDETISSFQDRNNDISKEAK